MGSDLYLMHMQEAQDRYPEVCRENAKLKDEIAQLKTEIEDLVGYRLVEKDREIERLKQQLNDDPRHWRFDWHRKAKEAHAALREIRREVTLLFDRERIGMTLGIVADKCDAILKEFPNPDETSTAKKA